MWLLFFFFILVEMSIKQFFFRDKQAPSLQYGVDTICILKKSMKITIYK